MRTVIQGNEITVTIKSDRELTVQEIISAHQLTTGNFEALFVSEDSSSQENPYSEPAKTSDDNIKHRPGWVEKGTWVEVEVLCPFCGCNEKTGTRWGNSFCKCPKCNEKLFNKFATGVPGETNNWGCHYVADEPIKFKDRLEEDEKLFLDDSK